MMTRRMRASIVAALRSSFEVLEGEDYEAAYKLLQEAGLDVLLLALPMESGGAAGVHGAAAAGWPEATSTRW